MCRKKEEGSRPFQLIETQDVEDLLEEIERQRNNKVKQSGNKHTLEEISPNTSPYNETGKRNNKKANVGNNNSNTRTGKGKISL